MTVAMYMAKDNKVIPSFLRHNPILTNWEGKTVFDLYTNKNILNTEDL